MMDGQTKVLNGEATQIYQMILAALNNAQLAKQTAFDLFSCGKSISQSSEIFNGMTVTQVPAILGGAGAGGCPTGVDPAFFALAQKKILDKKICRECYGRNPLNAFTCRKRKCGHSADLRPKKAIK